MFSGKHSNYLIVHIGSPKTGTTSIQEILNENRDDLQSHGIIYPVDHIEASGSMLRQVNGAILMPQYFDDQRLRSLFHSWFSLGPHVLLSDEVLFLDRNCESLKQLRNDSVGVAIICYLRDAASYTTSIWAELNRFENGTVVSDFEGFLKQNTYMRSILALLDLIYDRPEFEFYARPYPGLTTDYDVVADFLSVLGVNLGIDARSTSRTNVSLTRKEADIRQLQLQHAWPVADGLNSIRVSEICREIASGDDRSVVETIPDEVIEGLCKAHTLFLNHTLTLGGVQNYDFAHSFPECFGKERPAYLPISPHEYEKIRALLMEPMPNLGGMS